MTPPYAQTLARAVLTLAEDASMPDTYWDTDSRIRLALHILGFDADTARNDPRLERALAKKEPWR